MLRVENLVFEYPGKRALEDVSFEIDRGAITALVGPNGAGKTTLIRAMVALHEPFSGRVTLDGVSVHEDPREIHRRIGYLPDFFGLYDDLSVERCLHYAAAAQGVPDEILPARIERAAARLQIADRMQTTAGALSRGLRQRLAIAQSIIHEPELLVLDEPASGLDPDARYELSQLLRGLRDEGVTLVVSSHILAELEDYCSEMLVLREGRLVGHRQVGDTPRATDDSAVTVVLASEDSRLQSVLEGLPGAREVVVEGAGARLRLPLDASARAAALRALIAAGLDVIEFRAERERLQDAYFAEVRGTGPGREATPPERKP